MSTKRSFDMDSKANKNDESSVDEVDFIPTSSAKKEICVSCKSFNPLKKGFVMRNGNIHHNNNNNNNNNSSIYNNTPKIQSSTTPVKKTSVYGDCEIQTAVKSHISALERLHLFHFPLRKKSDPSAIHQEKSQLLATKEQRPRLIKSSSIARLFGNTYSTKKSEENHQTSGQLKKSYSVSEKFSNKSNESDDDFAFRMCENNMSLSESSMNLNSLDSSSAPVEKPNMKTIRSITKGLGKLLRRNCDSVEISAPDPEYKVFYLGNVLTGWAKGDACLEKPLATLWRNYTQNNKPEVLMRLKVCPSGLKATTRQHGLTEYWAHRITFCSAPRTYPKIFCWIYRHEGRKLKHELRCHAVICSKETHSSDIANMLKQNLAIALREFKRDKISKQNARLSLANAADENPSMPRRKILLSTGANNYRPPLERSKSAPKLHAIEEDIDEEDEECNDQEKVKKLEEKKKIEELKACCKEDYLYPSVTLGRRRCRRGHSIRKSRLLRGSLFHQNTYPLSKIPAISSSSASVENIQSENKKAEEIEEDLSKSLDDLNVVSDPFLGGSSNVQSSHKNLGSDEDFESFLRHNNYDSNDPLAGDLMSYFDMKLNTPPPSMITTATTTTMSMSDLLDDDLLLRNQRNSMSMSDLIDYQSDNELDDGELEQRDENIYFNQDSLLATLCRVSQTSKSITDENENIPNQHFIHDLNKSADEYEKTDESPHEIDYQTNQQPQSHNEFLYKQTDLDFEDDLTSNSPSSMCLSDKTICVNLDSDEGSSISSGCETSSTVTTNAEEVLPRRGSVLDRVRNFEQLAGGQVTREPIGERAASAKFFTRSVTFPSGNGGGTQSGSFMLSTCESKNGTLTRSDVTKNAKIQHDSDEELSDESGYVEFQDISLKSTYA